jgi:hypothetical protein
MGTRAGYCSGNVVDLRLGVLRPFRLLLIVVLLGSRLSLMLFVVVFFLGRPRLSLRGFIVILNLFPWNLVLGESTAVPFRRILFRIQLHVK